MEIRQSLDRWISKNSSRANFARTIGRRASYVTLLLQGKRGVSYDTAKIIENATGGAVTATDLLDEKPAREDA